MVRVVKLGKQELILCSKYCTIFIGREILFTRPKYFATFCKRLKIHRSSEQYLLANKNEVLVMTRHHTCHCTVLWYRTVIMYHNATCYSKQPLTPMFVKS